MAGASHETGAEKAAMILQSIGNLPRPQSWRCGIAGSHLLEKRQTIDTNVRLYTELMANERSPRRAAQGHVHLDH